MIEMRSGWDWVGKAGGTDVWGFRLVASSRNFDIILGNSILYASCFHVFWNVSGGTTQFLGYVKM